MVKPFSVEMNEFADRCLDFSLPYAARPAGREVRLGPLFRFWLKFTVYRQEQFSIRQMKLW